MTMEISAWALLSIWSVGLPIYILAKTRLPSKKGILASVILAALVSVAYLGIQMGLKVVVLNGVGAGLPTLLCSLAVFSLIEEKVGIKMISTGRKHAPLASLVTAIAVGAMLSIINYFLMKDSNTIDFKITISRLVVCLSPAIYEEIACRAIFMAFGLYAVHKELLRGHASAPKEKATKFQQFTIWFMMCVPHTAAHGYDIISTILLCILFGVPFAILQRKRDITSAMISHGIVDAVRFIIFGLGF